jgi:hypothetical protein
MRVWKFEHDAAAVDAGLPAAEISVTTVLTTNLPKG